MDFDGKTLGEAIRRFRQQAGWSRAHLARASGFSVQRIERIEAGAVTDDPGDDWFRRIGRPLGISADFLAMIAGTRGAERHGTAVAWLEGQVPAGYFPEDSPTDACIFGCGRLGTRSLASSDVSGERLRHPVCDQCTRLAYVSADGAGRVGRMRVAAQAEDGKTALRCILCQASQATLAVYNPALSRSVAGICAECHVHLGVLVEMFGANLLAWQAREPADFGADFDLPDEDDTVSEANSMLRFTETDDDSGRLVG